MPLAQVVVNQNGPLPITTKFHYQAQGPAMLYVSGTAWSQQAGQLLGIEVLIDGNSVGAAQVMTNEASSHKTLVSAFFPLDLDYGDHTLMIIVGDAATTTDQNDFYNVSVLYY